MPFVFAIALMNLYAKDKLILIYREKMNTWMVYTNVARVK